MIEKLKFKKIIELALLGPKNTVSPTLFPGNKLSKRGEFAEAAKHLSMAVGGDMARSANLGRPGGYQLSCLLTERSYKNPAYGRQSISRPMRIVAPIPQ